MSMLSIILGAAATIFVGYSRVSKHSSSHERNLVLGQTALDRMRCEVSSAVELFEPNPGSSATFSRIVLNKVDPSVTTRLPDPPDFTVVFEPRDPPTCQVEYSISSGELWRRAWGSSGWTSQELLLKGAVGLTTRFSRPAGVIIKLNLQEEWSTRLMTTFSTVWIRP